MNVKDAEGGGGLRSGTDSEKTYLTDELRATMYRLMDSFLVEAKDQHGNERSLERLNKDRHLLVAEALQAFAAGKLRMLDDIYALSPTKQFKDWKPEDAVTFFERLKEYERKLKDE